MSGLPAPRSFSRGHEHSHQPGEPSGSDSPGERLLAGVFLGLCWGLAGLCFGWLSARRQALQQNRLVELSLLAVGSHPDIARLGGRLAWTAFSRSARVAAWRDGADGGRATILDSPAAGPPAVLQPAGYRPGRFASESHARCKLVGALGVCAAVGGLLVGGLLSSPVQALSEVSARLAEQLGSARDGDASAASPTAAPTNVVAVQLEPTVEIATDRSGCRPPAAFAALVNLVGLETVGACLEPESTDPANGDLQQRAMGGLLALSKADNVAAFTDGATTWYGCPSGIEKRPSLPPFRCSGTILLADNFDDPDGGHLPQNSADPTSYTRGYLGGEYRVQEVGTQWDRLPGVFIPGRYDDAALGVDARLVDDPAHRYIGLGCRYQGKNSNYQFYVAPAAAQFSLSRWDNGSEAILAGWQTSPVIRRGNESNRLELSCVRDVIAASVNGTRVFSVQDGTYREGSAFLFVGVPAGAQLGAEVRFDNLTVVQ
jgi:hypothetical protein